MTPGPESLAAALGNRYAIERELGAGGMATEYLAHDLKHDRQVAKAAGEGVLTVVVNWGEALRARMGGSVAR